MTNKETPKPLTPHTLEGPLHYPSPTGAWQVGAVDLGEYLAQFRGQRVRVTVEPLGAAETARVCVGCGTTLDEGTVCERCRAHGAGNRRRWDGEALLGEDEGS